MTLNKKIINNLNIKILSVLLLTFFLSSCCDKKELCEVNDNIIFKKNKKCISQHTSSIIRTGKYTYLPINICDKYETYIINICESYKKIEGKK
jgi:hypothetical protein